MVLTGVGAAGGGVREQASSAAQRATKVGAAFMETSFYSPTPNPLKSKRSRTNVCSFHPMIGYLTIRCVASCPELHDVGRDASTKFDGSRHFDAVDDRVAPVRLDSNRQGRAREAHVSKLETKTSERTEIDELRIERETEHPDQIFPTRRVPRVRRKAWRVLAPLVEHDGVPFAVDRPIPLADAEVIVQKTLLDGAKHVEASSLVANGSQERGEIELRSEPARSRVIPRGHIRASTGKHAVHPTAKVAFRIVEEVVLVNGSKGRRDVLTR
jgi:hypothetical protein